MIRCPYCRDDLTTPGVVPSITACANCSASHHTECWRECGRCASCKYTQIGGPRLPATFSIINPSINAQLWALCFDVPLAATWDVGLVIKDLASEGLGLGIETILLARDVNRKILGYLVSKLASA